MKKLMITLFVVFLSLPWFLWYGVGAIAPGLQQKFTYTLDENRNIYDLDDGLEKFYDDRIPFRTYLITKYNGANNLLNRAYKNGAEGALVKVLYRGENADVVKAKTGDFPWILYGDNEGDEIREVEKLNREPVDTSYYPGEISACYVLRGREDWLFYVIGDDTLKAYKGEDILSESEMAERAEVYEEVQKECDRLGIKFELYFVPAKYQVYDEYMPSVEITNDPKKLPALVNYLNENTDVNVCYPLEELQFAGDYYQTFFKCDSHWNSVGAFVGTQTMYHGLGLPTTGLFDVDIQQDTNYENTWRDLLPLTVYDPAEFENKDFNYLVSYKDDVTAEGAPEGPRFQMEELSEITSDAKDDSHFVILGDSYRNLMMQYVAKDFAKTSVIHRDFLDQNIVESRELNYDDVLDTIKNDIADADYLVLEASEQNELTQAEYTKVVLNILKEL